MMGKFTLGTGASLYSQKLLPAILVAEHEVILVTCFWAPSKTLTALSNTLAQLAKLRSESHHSSPPLRLRICFSSRSLFQKLFHTSSPDGYVYPPSTWAGSLGLPSPETFAAGNIDLRVKSLFFLPFSVMHPKFLIVDRQRAYAPSCNISWESWLEGCLEIARTPSASAAEYHLIDGLLDFYRRVWDKELDLTIALPASFKSIEPPVLSDAGAMVRSPLDMSVNASVVDAPCPPVQWLPSWHHRDPAFCMFPWQTPEAPATPLNKTTLRLFETSTREIYVQTPNLTAPPVLAAIYDCLARGVHVHVVTGQNMMLWEQIATAFTTTSWCIRTLTHKYESLCRRMESRGRSSSHSACLDTVDLEAQTITPGVLTVSYFTPPDEITLEEEPVHSHLKLAIFDGEHTLLGSGNMDRASWFTSQELGILIQDAAFARTIKDTVSSAVAERLMAVFPAP